MWMRNIDSHLRLVREETVLAHVRSLVVRERAAGRGRQGPQFARAGLPHGGRIVGFQRHQPDLFEAATTPYAYHVVASNWPAAETTAEMLVWHNQRGQAENFNKA